MKKRYYIYAILAVACAIALSAQAEIIQMGAKPPADSTNYTADKGNLLTLGVIGKANSLCPAGQYRDLASGNCVSCVNNYYSPSVGSPCIPCPEGYKPNTGHTACEPCSVQCASGWSNSSVCSLLTTTETVATQSVQAKKFTDSDGKILTSVPAECTPFDESALTSDITCANFDPSAEEYKDKCFKIATCAPGHGYSNTSKNCTKCILSCDNSAGKYDNETGIGGANYNGECSVIITPNKEYSNNAAEAQQGCESQTQSVEKCYTCTSCKSGLAPINGRCPPKETCADKGYSSYQCNTESQTQYIRDINGGTTRCYECICNNGNEYYNSSIITGDILEKTDPSKRYCDLSSNTILVQSSCSKCAECATGYSGEPKTYESCNGGLVGNMAVDYQKDPNSCTRCASCGSTGDYYYLPDLTNPTKQTCKKASDENEGTYAGVWINGSVVSPALSPSQYIPCSGGTVPITNITVNQLQEIYGGGLSGVNISSKIDLPTPPGSACFWVEGGIAYELKLRSGVGGVIGDEYEAFLSTGTSCYTICRYQNP